MTRTPRIALLTLLVALMAMPALAQQDAPKKDNAERAQRDRGERRNMNWRQNSNQREPSIRLLYQIAMLNMTPEFTLTSEQKTQIKQARDGFKADQENYKAENKAKVDFIRGKLQTARENSDRDAAREAWEDYRALMQAGPREKTLDKAIMDILTADQRELVETKLAEIEAQRQQMREQWEQRRQQRNNGGQDNEPTI